MPHGITWLDCAVVVLILVFCIRGAWRGTVRQVFSGAGVVGGLWAAGWIAQWVGSHWYGARPAVVFGVLRWLVAGLGALAVASLFRWWGELLSGPVKQSPFGWLDRLGGFAVGAVLGVAVAAFVLLGLVLGPWPREVGASAARARVALPLMSGSARVCALGAAWFPGSDWLRRRFLAAGRRLSLPAHHS